MNCTKCQGTGTYLSWENKVEPCNYCKGQGTFDPPNLEQISNEIFTKRGLKSSVVSYKVSPRSYYVWRMARFHGGIDMTMPITAMILIEGDPYIAELDAFADSVATTCFGSSFKAAARWGLL